ncbi:MAG: dephospho-CoA kinase [Bacteroidota bacterium]
MRRPLKIGITGGIGSGKTTICEIFSRLNVPVYNADERARWLMHHNKKIINGVNLIFSPMAYINGELNRAHLSAMVFSDHSLLRKLNELVHPVVQADFLNWVKQQDSDYVIKEAALLFESKSFLDLDAVICVTAAQSIRIERTMRRDGLSEEAVFKRIKNQLNQSVKEQLADYIIENNPEDLIIPQVLRLHKFFCD